MRSKSSNRASSAEVTAAQLLTNILCHVPRDNEYQLWPLDTDNGKQSIHTLIDNLSLNDLKSILFACDLVRFKNGSLLVVKSMEALPSLIIGNEKSMNVQINTVRRIVNGERVGYYTNITIKDASGSHQGSKRTRRSASSRINSRSHGVVVPSFPHHPCVPPPPIDFQSVEKYRKKLYYEECSKRTEIPLNKENTMSSPRIITFNPKYPVLSQFGISTDFSHPHTELQLNSILKEIEYLTKERVLSSTRKNNTRARVVFVPQLSSQKAFNNWERNEKGMSSLIESISNGNILERTNDPIAVQFITSFIFTNYPDTFNAVTENSGATVIERMNAIETAALLSDMGVADKKVLVTLHRHMKYKTDGANLFASKKDIDTLTNRMPTIETSEPVYVKAPGEKEETLGVVLTEIDELVRLDMDRMLQYNLSDVDLNDDDSATEPLFSYRTKSSEKGIYVLMGTDHGQGTAQFLIRLNLGSSEERRLKERPDYKTRTLPFSTIKCKKDSTEILEMTAKVANDGIETLRTKQLVAIIDEAKTIVRTYFVNGDAKEFVIRDNKLITTGLRGAPIYDEIEICNTMMELGRRLFYKVIVSNFHVLQIGDLAVQMTLQGRDGMSSCRCIKCNLTQAQWKAGANSELLTADDLCQPIPNERIGQKNRCIYGIYAPDLVTPILHCEIGTVNDQFFKCLVKEIILPIDCGNEDELQNRLQHLELSQTLRGDQERLDELITHLDFQKRIHHNTRKDLIKNRATLKRRIKSASNSTRPNKEEQVQLLERELVLVQRQLKRIDDARNSIKNGINIQQASITAKKKRIASLVTEVKDMQWKRRWKGDTLYTKVERILQRNGVTIQAYHGGTLTGGAIIQLLKKHEVIMAQIREVCTRAINLRTNDNLPLRPPSMQSIQQKLDLHDKLFKAQDAVYAHLRLIKPTSVEIIETRRRIRVMKRLWHEMNLSETPKAHLIFEHAADDQAMFDGIGDKIEDPIEKRHQEQMRIDHILSKMHGGFKARMKTQHRYEWRNNDPGVLKQIQQVYKHTSRNKRNRGDDIMSLAQARDKVVKKERRDQRAQNVVDIVLGFSDDE